MRPVPGSPFVRLLQANQWVCPSCEARVRLVKRRKFASAQGEHHSLPPFPLNAIQKGDGSLGGEKDSPTPSHGVMPFKQWLKDRKNDLPASPSIDVSTIEARLREFGVFNEDLHSQSQLDVGSLNSIPLSSWIEILRKLDPATVLPPFHRIHQSLNPRKMRQAGVQLRARRGRLLETIDMLWNQRKYSSIPKTLTEYRVLLKYAATMGARDWATSIWEELKFLRIEPDLACYNYYMQSIVWDEEARLQQAKRAGDVTPKKPDMPRWTTVMLWESGSSSAITELLYAMRSQRLSPDAQTYCAYMTALARDGKINEVIDILTRVWGLNVRELMAGQAITHVSAFDKGSPLYPNQALLMTIADTLGSYNQIMVALRLIDFVSQHYGIPIKESIWTTLIKWSTLHAGLETNREARLQMATIADRIFRAAVTAPYNVEPSLEMLHQISQNQRTLALLGTNRYTVPVEFTRLLHLSEMARERRSTSHLLKAQKAQKLGSVSVSASHLRRLQKRSVHLTIRRRISGIYLSRLVRSTLKAGVPDKSSGSLDTAQLQEWRSRGIPNFIQRYRSFTPSTVQYQVEGGIVKLQFRTREEIEVNRAMKPQASNRAGVRWATTGRRHLAGERNAWQGRKWTWAGDAERRQLRETLTTPSLSVQ